MPVLMNTFWSDLGVVGGNTSATNQYDLWKGITFNDGFVCASQYDFFTHLGTNRYEFFKSYNSVDSNIVSEYTFYQNTSDPNIYDFKTFYEYAAQYLIPSITPTPTPSITPSPTPLPIDCIWNLNDELWENNTNDWNECQNVITPTPTQTSTNTPTPSITPSPSPAPFDADAASFLEAVLLTGGTLNATISGATNTLFTDLKSAGLYNDLFFFPMIGGTSASIGLFAKRSSGSTYDYSWSGTLAFGYSGVTGNAGRGTTTLNRTNFSTQGNVSIGCYVIGDDSNTVGYEMQNQVSDNNMLITRFTNGLAYTRYDGTFKTASNASGLGFYVSTQTGSTSGVNKLIKNGNTTLINVASDDTHYNTQNNFILYGGADGYSQRTMNFVIYTKYLTDAQVETLSNIINTFQTTLGRNTY